MTPDMTSPKEGDKTDAHRHTHFSFIIRLACWITVGKSARKKRFKIKTEILDDNSNLLCFTMTIKSPTLILVEMYCYT